MLEITTMGRFLPFISVPLDLLSPSNSLKSTQ
ncbi:MAG: hypothetical protein MRERV_74c002 [Mycoplasmataceae bacterium RV_VA103A]|nr:MAG: hypothetical protein MRERV_74c002 [Mycoplasmataceae bacterium RV_VA103A]